MVCETFILALPAATNLTDYDFGISGDIQEHDSGFFTVFMFHFYVTLTEIYATETGSSIAV